MNIPDGVRNTFVFMGSFYCTKAATTKEIQYHPQITAWQRLFQKAWGHGFLSRTKDQPNTYDGLPAVQIFILLCLESG